MPVHVEEMTTEVTMIAGDLPMTDAQVEKLVKLIMKRLKDQEREGEQIKEATQIRRGAAPKGLAGG